MSAIRIVSAIAVLSHTHHACHYQYNALNSREHNVQKYKLCYDGIADTSLVQHILILHTRIFTHFLRKVNKYTEIYIIGIS